MKNFSAIVISTALAVAPFAATAAPAVDNQAAITSAIKPYMPGVTGFGTVKAENVTVNSAKKTVTVKLSANAAYVPFTAESLASFKSDCLKALGPQFNGYKITLYAGDKSLDSLVLFASKKNIGPKEKTPFITREGLEAAPDGLDGANIALWQSHGWYFEPKLNRWEWQRARIFQTVEDLYTQSYVMPFLMPMLENAGAYVMSPRERDINLNEVIIDNDGALAAGKYSEKSGRNKWQDSGKSGFAYTKEELHEGDNPFQQGSTRKINLSGKDDRGDATAAWNAEIPEDGSYAVYVSYTTLPNSTEKAHYRVNAADGAHDFTINQRMGGGTWIYLGHFPFKAGVQNAPIVELSNAGRDSKKVVTADAVKIGGGYGHVARRIAEPVDGMEYDYVTSNYPRFTEGARYFLQYAGAPDSVYTPSNNVYDYGDDYKSRGLWVNWLAGGSSMLPGQEGLNIPVDLSFAFHSDAGTTMNDSIIGTLGIYCTSGDKTGNGSSRMASRDFTDLVLTNITNDVRATFEPNWTRRGMWDKSYFEARVPEVPAMLLELLSHQNFADMSYGLDPAFRFVVSRAIYKGMLQFLAHRDGREYVVQPLPVRSFAIAADSKPGTYTLTWAERVDSLEASATPTYYIVEERVGNGAFRQVAKVEKPEYTVTVADSDIHSYRIIAGNSGGRAFPSEVLALCNKPGDPVLIVNGFTRVSAPDRFDSGEIAGFYDARDHGVPYLYDISFIGSQFEFRRNIPWMDDDAAGFGASRANYEDKVVAGNTFDYVYTHGEAISAAGRGFISSSVEAFSNSAVPAGTPATIDLILGKQKEIVQGRGVFGPRFKTFPSELQARIAAHTAAGGNIFVSGAYVATDLWDNPNSSEETAAEDQKFAREVLGYNWRVGQASITGEAYQVQTPFKQFGKGVYTFSNTLNSDCYAVESPDSFYASDAKKGATFMRYSENNLVAGTVFDNTTYRTVVLGFPFETISGDDAREHLMSQILEFLKK